MELYAEYIAEREGFKMIRDEYGFATYYINEHENFVYLRDIFVTKNYRRNRHAWSYADKIVEIAKELKLEKMVGSICLDTNGATASMKTLLAYGFEIKSVHGNMIYLEKEI